MDKIIVKGARENNLKNIDIEIPKNSLVVMTGVSGSGKSSLAFDTIYAEGQRRYVESLSSYARQFLGGTSKPDVDSIDGLSPSISIDQKSTNNNPRSTVGTVTEIYDYFRLLFARIGIPYCPNHHEPIKSQSIEEMTNKILEIQENTKLEIMSPIVRGEKGSHQEIIEELRQKGFTKVRINGEVKDLTENIKLEKNKKDTIEVIVDRVIVKSEERSRIYESIEQASNLSDGLVLFNVIDKEEFILSENYACVHCHYSMPALETRMFSFNSPFGACEECNGLGNKMKISEELLMPDMNKSIREGGIKTVTQDQNILYTEIETVAAYYNIDLDAKLKNIPRDKIEKILYGTPIPMEFKYVSRNGNIRTKTDFFEGIINNLERRYIETSASWVREWIEGFMIEQKCPSCDGKRLKKEVLNVYINKKNIYDMISMSIEELHNFMKNLKLNKEQQKISELLIKEICNRLEFLNNVGLGYITLDRSAGTLSGGEAQRIRLATQIGSKLSGVLYVLDEPSIGLHQRDNEKLIKSMKEMRDLGNTLIVVEHDTDTMLASDFLIDIGPGAGTEGGNVMAFGTPKEVMENPNSLTGKYLKGIEKIDVPSKRRKGNGLFLEIKGAEEHNLKKINVKIPLGKLVCVTGVSGSGKSTLVNDILFNALTKKVYKSKTIIGKCKEIKGMENIDKVVHITQDPIGRTPRSNPATYVGVFDDIREVFSNMKESKMRGYGKNRFSFNVKGGRCEACSGDGVKRIEMNFLPDVYVPCEICKGTRYNRETLDVKYKGKNISEVLHMRVKEALEFFESIPKVKNKLQVMMDVGLSYIELGQSAPTLSGGEAGRIKLAKELQKKATGKSVFILDEPTTGLHTHDIKKLLDILQRIVDNGDTVVVIEHNLDVIKVADHLIDLGPEGGNAGGNIVAEGTPEKVSKVKESYTGQWLKKYL